MSHPVPRAPTPPGAGMHLITGASGFIGGRLARRLAGEGRAVRCLVRASSDTGALRDLQVEIVQGDLADNASLARAVEGVERIVHCAAMVSDWGTRREIAHVNVTGTRSLLEAASAAGTVRRLVHLSTTDVYGHPGTHDVGESLQPTGFANWYSQTKREAEEEVRSSSLDAVILRPATVYGPGSREVIGEIAKAVKGGHMLLIDRGRADAGLLYVENLLDAIVLALDTRGINGETFNLSDGLPVSWRALCEDLAAALNGPRVRLSLPYGLAAAIGTSMEVGYRALRRATGLTLPALLSRQAVQVLGRDQSFSSARARELLAWEPRVGYVEGLKQTVAWLREDFLPAG